MTQSDLACMAFLSLMVGGWIGIWEGPRPEDEGPCGARTMAWVQAYVVDDR